jgi:signal peptidase I
MEPAFFRGDLLFLTNHQDEPIKVGDIVVFKIEGRDIPIVHRVLQLHDESVLSAALGCVIQKFQ